MQITSSHMLAQELRNYRKKQKLTQRETANNIGIKQATISSFENNPQGTKLETLFKILASLGLELALKERGLDENTTGWDQEW